MHQDKPRADTTTPNRNNIWLYITITLAYALLITAIVTIGGLDFSTPARADLTKANVYLHDGYLSDYSRASTADYGWLDLTGKSWQITSTELGKPYLQPMFTPTDLPVHYYTYVIEFPYTADQLAYIQSHSIIPGFFFSVISDNWDIYLNDNLVERQMFIEDEKITIHRNVNGYNTPFDASLLKEGINQLVIHIAISPNYTDSGLFMGGKYFIDDYAQIRNESNDFMLMFFASVSFFMALYNIIVFIGNPGAKYYLYFSCVEFLLSIYIVMNTYEIQYFILDTQIRRLIEYIMLGTITMFAVLFAHALAKTRVKLPMKILMCFQLAIVASLPFVGVECCIDILTVLQIILLVQLLYCFVICFRVCLNLARVYAGSLTFKSVMHSLFTSVCGYVSMGIIIVLIASIGGVLATMFFNLEQNTVIVGLFAFVMAVSFALANELNQSKQALADANTGLEAKVLERTSQLQEQTQLAIAANEGKSRFLATMSHEIRTPMNAIIGISEIELTQSSLSPRTRDALDRIYASGKSLLGIINDILDLSKADTGKLDLICGEYDFPSVLNDTVQLNIVRIGSKKIDFTLTLDEKIPIKLNGDELRIKQIMNNVLSNAFKYTEEGSVKMTVACEPVDENHVRLTFTVADTGQGMKKEDLDRIFTAYTQFNREDNRKVEGTGLGMNITYKLVQLMGGTISVESELGKGSVFTVVIDQKITPGCAVLGKELSRKLCSFSYKSDTSVVSQIKRAYMPYGSVLIVDDIETNLYVAEGLMAPYGLSIEKAGSGMAAIDKIESGRRYDIVFMDHMMPEMDGIETTGRIRSLGYTLPIIALTANALVGNDKLFMDNGFDDFMSKPIDAKRLDEVLNQYVKGAHPDEAAKVEIQIQADNNTESQRAGSQRAESQGAGAQGSGAQRIEKQNAGLHSTNASILPQPLIDAFLRDAKKAWALFSQYPAYNDFTILATSAHGMKAACANIGENDLSGRAKTLEMAFKNNQKDVIDRELSVFTADLKTLIERLSPDQEFDVSADISADCEDRELLQKELKLIKDACEEYDEVQAKFPLDRLLQGQWTSQTKERLEQIQLHLFHSEFEEAGELCMID
jgi:signal transduction histidine kinase/CheY-like chemotaxis protein/HPt (histidine-containing phosphotransfer) domain-containing protein